jgi:hypothetical protein
LYFVWAIVKRQSVEVTNISIIEELDC